MRNTHNTTLSMLRKLTYEENEKQALQELEYVEKTDK